MNNSSNPDLKEPELLKQIWKIGNKYLVVIDESIIKKLGFNDDLTIFLLQELTKDGILMRVKKFDTGELEI